jgi:hypothetical protein
VPVDEANLIRDRLLVRQRLTRRFVRLTPGAPDDSLPNLPIIGWHLLQRNDTPGDRGVEP